MQQNHKYCNWIQDKSSMILLFRMRQENGNRVLWFTNAIWEAQIKNRSCYGKEMQSLYNVARKQKIKYLSYCFLFCRTYPDSVARFTAVALSKLSKLQSVNTTLRSGGNLRGSMFSFRASRWAWRLWNWLNRLTRDISMLYHCDCWQTQMSYWAMNLSFVVRDLYHCFPVARVPAGKHCFKQSVYVVIAQSTW